MGLDQFPANTSEKVNKLISCIKVCIYDAQCTVGEVTLSSDKSEQTNTTAAETLSYCWPKSRNTAERSIKQQNKFNKQFKIHDYCFKENMFLAIVLNVI